MVLLVKNLRANAGDVRDRVSVPGSGRSPGGGHSNPLKYSCSESHRGAWQATVHGVAESRTQLKQLSTHTHEKYLNSYRKHIIYKNIFRHDLAFQIFFLILFYF